MSDLCLSLFRLFSVLAACFSCSPVCVCLFALSQDYVDKASLPANWDWRNVSGINLVTENLNQHIPVYCGSWYVTSIERSRRKRSGGLRSCC